LGWLCLLVSTLISFGLAGRDSGWLTLWPTVSALIVVFLSRSAFIGLSTGAAAGAVLLGGTPLAAMELLLFEQFLPIFESPWKLSAMAFTLILGGFVALLEAGGGLQAILRRILGAGRGRARRMQLTVVGFGLFVFFDGLANTMLIGRTLRTAADRSGVSRVKLAYLADTTGSAVACVAFISTWIAFQLSMIESGFAIVGREANAYALFFRSVPANFYCWFALATALVCICRNFNPGPMGRAELLALASSGRTAADEEEVGGGGHWAFALLPVLVLTFSIPVLAYAIGAERWWPLSPAKFAEAYGRAEPWVPQILVAASLLASLVAAWPLLASKGPAKAGRVFGRGVRDLMGPIGILVAAWMLGAGIQGLGAAGQISELLTGRLDAEWLPVAIFLTGAAISFSTGTSWGTMGVLMPLAIPVVLSLGGGPGDPEAERLVVAAIAAVFSGAVFGDHCSPFSDTTIVSSIAAGVEPVDHVRTQLPFALIAAAVAAVAGFIPLGFGLSPWAGLALGLSILFALPSIVRVRIADSLKRKDADVDPR